MKVLVHSAPPMADTGYGVHTKNLVRRLKDDHNVAIHSVGGWEGMGIDWEGIQVYPSGAGEHGEKSIPYWFDKTESDVVFSHHDHWAMSDVMSGIQQNGIPIILYTVLDHDLPGKRAPEAVVQANENSCRTITMSEWAKQRLRNSRVPQEKVSQIPHGVDTSKYAPVTDEIPQSELKRDLGVPEDGFLFGMVAANYGPRKNIPLHMQAFKELRDEHGLKDIYFYIHTHPTMGGGYNLYEIRDALNIEEEHCLFPDPHEMYHGIEDLVVVQLYNTFDVHLNVTQSESWGLTITEAMSCETPVIAANNSAMTEQFGVAHDTFVTQEEGFRVTDQGILVHRGNELWTQNASARRYTCSVEDMKQAMLYYYENRDEIDEHGENAREWVCETYNWDRLYDAFWKPLFDDVEEELDDEYNNWYYKRRSSEAESEAFQKEALEIALETRGDEILDVGCGTGKLMQYLERKGYTVTGIEKSQSAIEYIEENVDEELQVYFGDARHINMKDNSYDTVVCQHVLEHIEADVHALSEMCRAAREKVIAIVPTGSVVDSVDKTEKRRYTVDTIEELNEEFREYTDGELQYRKLHTTQTQQNWIITIDVDTGDSI